MWDDFELFRCWIVSYQWWKKTRRLIFSLHNSISGLFRYLWRIHLVKDSKGLNLTNSLSRLEQKRSIFNLFLKMISFDLNDVLNCWSADFSSQMMTHLRSSRYFNVWFWIDFICVEKIAIIQSMIVMLLVLLWVHYTHPKFNINWIQKTKMAENSKCNNEIWETWNL
jgi:hypothetical protein